MVAKVLILGASGMLGNSMVRVLQGDATVEVWATVRNLMQDNSLGFNDRVKILRGVDVTRNDCLEKIFSSVIPDTVINCVGIVKQAAEIENHLQTIYINSLLPHRLLGICRANNARLVHISTDCVFSGKVGNYSEQDYEDADDFYGRSKLLGEVYDEEAITLRTSIIGHEIYSSRGLVNWFLSQKDSCMGFSRAIFSGFPSIVLAQIIKDYVLPTPSLNGLYHLSSSPISKLELLQLIAKTYGIKIKIVPDDKLSINRSLNSEKFQKKCGFIAPSWAEMILTMHKYK